MVDADKQTGAQPRPPIVTIMGHVDHGKTSLLDAIRTSNIAGKEHGGITQHIGAYQVTHQGKKITFIDTPGHAAFSQMRQRGAQVTDIVILVVAANDGIKPQTIESIKHIHEAKVPVIVAINKVDLPDASPEMVKAQLTEHQIFTEGYGGNTPSVNISALKKQGIDELLETILLIAELEELTADPNASVEAIIIESNMDKNRGPVATAIVKQGTLKPGDTIYAGTEEVKVRALNDEYKKQVKLAEPGKPVEMLGFKNVPEVGAVMTGIPVVKQSVTKEAADTKNEISSEGVEKGEETPKLEIILKADTAGTLEAIQNSLTGDIVLLQTGVGPISEADILLAKNTRAPIFGFSIPILPSAKKLAELEKVKVHTYAIIYELLENLEKRVLKMLEPTIDEEEVGVAEVLAIFEMKGDKIAGCKVKSGEISKQHALHLVRDEKTLTDVYIKSLKRGKEDVPAVKVGTECGIILRNNVDFRVGDMLKSYKKIDE